MFFSLFRLPSPAAEHIASQRLQAATGNVFTAEDAAELHFYFSCKPLLPNQTRETLVHLADPSQTAEVLRKTPVFATLAFGGSLEDALRWFEFGCFRHYTHLVDLWSEEEKESLTYAWLKGKTVYDIYTSKTENRALWRYSNEQLQEYASKLPDHELYAPAPKVRHGDFFLCHLTKIWIRTEPNYPFPTDDSMVRLKILIAEFMKRGLRFTTGKGDLLRGWNFATVWKISSWNRAHIPQFEHVFQAAVELEAGRSPVYHKTLFKDYAPALQQTLVTVACMFRFRRSHFNLHKDILPLVYAYVVENAYREFSAQLDAIAELAEIYRRRLSATQMTSMFLDRGLPSKSSFRWQYQLAAKDFGWNLSPPDKEAYVTELLNNWYNFIGRSLHRTNTHLARQLAETCFDHQLAVSLLKNKTIKLNSQFEIFDLEEAVRLSKEFLASQKQAYLQPPSREPSRKRPKLTSRK